MSFFNVNATFYSFMKFKGESRQFSVRFRRRSRDHNKTFRSRSGPHNRSQLITAVSMLCLLCLFKLYKITGYLISHCSFIIHRSFFTVYPSDPVVTMNQRCAIRHTPYSSDSPNRSPEIVYTRWCWFALVRVRP